MKLHAVHRHGPSKVRAVEQDYEQTLADSERVLDDVDKALARLDDGSYANCETCGAPIREDHLEATPTIRSCEQHLALGTVSA